LITNYANQHDYYDHDFGLAPTEPRTLNGLKDKPSDQEPPKTLVGFWPHESEVEKEPQSSRQERTHDLAYVILGVFVFAVLIIWRSCFGDSANAISALRFLLAIAVFLALTIWMFFFAQ
jgi:hypothetical protein